MRNVIVSTPVHTKLDELAEYLRNELKLSEKSATEYRGRFLAFIGSFRANVDYPLCRFKRWRVLGYRCAVFEKDWVLAYEVVEQGVIVRDISHAKLLKEWTHQT